MSKPLRKSSRINAHSLIKRVYIDHDLKLRVKKDMAIKRGAICARGLKKLDMLVPKKVNKRLAVILYFDNKVWKEDVRVDLLYDMDQKICGEYDMVFTHGDLKRLRKQIQNGRKSWVLMLRNSLPEPDSAAQDEQVAAQWKIQEPPAKVRQHEIRKKMRGEILKEAKMERSLTTANQGNNGTAQTGSG